MPQIEFSPIHQKSMLKRFLYFHYGKGATLQNIKDRPRRDIGIDVRGGLTDVVDADVIELGGITWYQQMDELYERYQTLHPHTQGTGDARTAYSAYISPDPKDHCSLEQLRELTTRWLDENFPLCSAVVVYHNDNAERIARGEEGIIHAHITINAIKGDAATSTKDLAKFHFSKNDMNHFIDSVQDIAKDMGLSYFDNTNKTYKLAAHDEKANDRSSLAGPERYIVQEGRYSWKDELREVVRRTVPFCANLAELRSSLAPFGFGVTLVDERSGVLLFTNPEGRKVNSRKLGFDFKKQDFKRFYMQSRATDVINGSYATYKDEVQTKREFLQSRSRLAKELQQKLDVLTVISRENITCYEDFNARKRELNSAGKDATRDLDLVITEIEGSTTTIGIGEVYDKICDVEEYEAVYDKFQSLSESDALSFWNDHSHEITAYADAQDWLSNHGYSIDEYEEITAEFHSLANRQIDLQASIEGYSRRIVDLNDAQYIVRQMQQELLVVDNEERVQRGLSPRVEKDPDFRKPPKQYATNKPPVFKLNISKARYQQIKESNRSTRRLLARSEPDRRLPPYIKAREQMERSIADEQRRHIEIPKPKEQEFVSLESNDWQRIANRSAREHANEKRKGIEQ